MSASRRLIWCSRRSAAAARCSSNRCGRPAWPASRRSSSSTCRPPASHRSRGSGSPASTTSRSCACSIRSTRASRTSHQPEIWRDYIRTVGRTPNGVWGGKLMWNQTPLLLRARRRICPTAPATACSPRSATSSAAIRSWCTSTGPTWCPRRCRSGARCRPGSGAAGPIRCATPAPSTTPARSRTSSPCCASRRRAGGPGSTRRTSTPIEVSYPVLWRNLTQIVGTVLEALGLGSAAGAARRCWNARPINAPTNG